MRPKSPDTLHTHLKAGANGGGLLLVDVECFAFWQHLPEFSRALVDDFGAVQV